METQIYVVHEDYKNMNLLPVVKELLDEFRIEISKIDLKNYVNLFMNSEKEFPFDGVSTNEIWDIIMGTGLKIKSLIENEVIDETFKNKMLEINDKLFKFGCAPNEVRLKIVK